MTMTGETFTQTPPIRRLDAPTETELRQLADVLCDCVAGNASVSFMQPFTMERAIAFWRDVSEAVARGERVLLVADDASGIVGTVQLVLSQPENQPHRADLVKLLVHRRARRRGVAAQLMQAAEQAAKDCGKTLLVLDTASGEAERVYERQGWQRVGVIPNYALLPDGAPCDTTYFYRDLAQRGMDAGSSPA
jgi:GNAT superfamily N-acetyltransferase